MGVAQEDAKILRIGGTVGFDFMNTNYKLVELVEVFDSPEALLFWMVDSHLIAEKDVKAIKQRFSTRVLDGLLADVLELRTRLRQLVAAFKEKNDVAKEDLLHLNDIFRRGSSYLQVEVYGKNQIRMQRAHDWKSVEEVLAIIVESVVTALSTEDFDLIRKCENPKCSIWFIDRTKAHRRKFCSQAICGNRAKQAAYRERNSTSKPPRERIKKT